MTGTWLRMRVMTLAVAAGIGVGWGVPASAATCPPQYQENWVEPQFANSTAVLSAAITAVDLALSTLLEFHSERLNSAVAVLTKQKALTANQLADTNRTTAQATANGLRALAQAERVKAARFDYGPEFGQGFEACEVYATRSLIASRAADMDTQVNTRVQSEVIAAPGRYASRDEAANQLLLDNLVSCTQDLVDAGLCAGEGALPGATMSVATLFEPALEGDELYAAKNTFVNNLVGLPDPPIELLDGVSQEAYMAVKMRKDALVSAAITSLKFIQLDHSGVHGDETGDGLPMAQLMRDEVARYVGDGEESERWAKAMTAQNERGAMVEVLKVKALDLALQARQLRQYERIEANLAALVAAQTRESAARVRAGEAQAAVDAASAQVR